MKARSCGFTIVEMMATLILLGIVGMLTLPTLILPGQDRQTVTMIQNGYTLMGEMYMARKDDIAFPAEDIGGNERANFGRYLYGHLNYMSAVNPTGVSDYCAANDYFKMPLGQTIRSICDVPGSRDSLQVTLRIPTNNNTKTMDFTVVIPEGERRYTTLYGFGTGTCGFVDQVLHTVDSCS